MISRRVLLSVLGGVPWAVVLSEVRPAHANASGLEPVVIRSPNGRYLRGFLSLPRYLPAPAVLTIHGSLGLTDWYKSRAAAFAEEGFVGLAVDLFPGQLAGTLDGEHRLIDEADSNPGFVTETLVTWVDWLRREPRTNGKVGIVGWSFGAWWALKASMATPADATILLRLTGRGPHHAGRRDS